MVPVFRADREVVKACREARRAHRESLAEYGDYRRAWELARLLANKTARSVKRRPIPPTRETECHEMDAHMKKVFGADRTTNTGNIQDHDPPYQCGSMAEIAALIPPLQKRAGRLARIRAVPNEIHAVCLDGAEEAVEEFWRSGTPLPARMAWYAILESRMQKRKKGSPIAFGQRGIHNTKKKAARAHNFSGLSICWMASAR